jgi:hypothetical protein
LVNVTYGSDIIIIIIIIIIISAASAVCRSIDIFNKDCIRLTDVSQLSK